VGTGQTFFTHGLLDEVDIFNRALTGIEPIGKTSCEFDPRSGIESYV
jgi:hypothetical protein